MQNPSPRQDFRTGGLNPLVLAAVVTAVLICGLIYMLVSGTSTPGEGTAVARFNALDKNNDDVLSAEEVSEADSGEFKRLLARYDSDGDGSVTREEYESQVGKKLTVYCAAGMQKPMTKIAEQYQEEYGIEVTLDFAGSNTLLNRIELNPEDDRHADLYLAGDNSYIEMAQEKGLVAEALPMARMRPVIAVKKGNPKNIQSIDDLINPDLTVLIGNPDQAAVGKKTRKLLTASGHWDKLEPLVRENGTFKPTVNELANDVLLDADAAIVWDAVVKQYPDLEYVQTPELDAGEAEITIGVVAGTEQPVDALRFARYATAPEKGQKTFEEEGWEVIQGDTWEKIPELTFYAGAINRKALTEIVEEFQQREGVQVNLVYNGCGILTSQMKSMVEKDQSSGFPDMFMACDVYYLDVVADLFQDGVEISNDDIVIVVQEGNPQNIQTLEDLSRDKLTLVLGHPEKCTIGVLSRKLLEAEGLMDKIQPNVVSELPSSANLVPAVVTGNADATLAYRTDTFGEEKRIDAIDIDHELAHAVQPYSVAKSSKHPQLGERLFEKISQSRDNFEKAGFKWRLDKEQEAPASTESKAESTTNQQTRQQETQPALAG